MNIKALAVALALIVAAPLVTACGEASTLAAPLACPSPPPIPTASGPTPRGGPQGQGAANFTYVYNVQQRFSQLQDLYQHFKLDYPNNNFVRDDTFRPAVAKFIDDSVCMADAFKAVEPSPTFQGADANLDAAIADYEGFLTTGREAVRTRNSTDYHAFWNGLDARINVIKELVPRSSR